MGIKYKISMAKRVAPNVNELKTVDFPPQTIEISFWYVNNLVSWYLTQLGLL